MCITVYGYCVPQVQYCTVPVPYPVVFYTRHITIHNYNRYIAPERLRSRSTVHLSPRPRLGTAAALRRKSRRAQTCKQRSGNPAQTTRPRRLASIAPVPPAPPLYHSHRTSITNTAISHSESSRAAYPSRPTGKSYSMRSSVTESSSSRGRLGAENPRKCRDIFTRLGGPLEGVVSFARSPEVCL